MSARDIMHDLRNAIGLGDFAELMFALPLAKYPNISSKLPSMASDEIQKKWTGSSGIPLLKQTLSFVRAIVSNYTDTTGRTLRGGSILDYGCGYGRIARLMYHLTDSDKIMGVDPWARSIEICHENGLGDRFRVSDYLPTDLPLSGETFDLIYAFSVFTHLSERAMRAALSACRKYVKSDGVMVITIRPIEYWIFNRQGVGVEASERLMAEHRNRGFAFQPHNRAKVDGDITYGDTSMSIEWIERAIPGWTIQGTDRSVDDPYQIYVLLRPIL